MSQKIKHIWFNKCVLILILISLSINVALEWGTTTSTIWYLWLKNGKKPQIKTKHLQLIQWSYWRCLRDDLITTKLNAYGFSLGSSRTIHSYLTNGKQSIRINASQLLGRNSIWRVTGPKFVSCLNVWLVFNFK